VIPSAEQIASRHPELDDAPLLGRYALEGKIGRGGMGVIADAHDRRIGRRVAIKRLSGQPTPDTVTRFVREARIQGRLDHPAVVPVYDLGIQSDGRPYFAMRKLSGVTLAEVLRQDGGPWTRARLLESFVDVCLAIEYAHTRGVLHRDLKPANVMIGDQGGVFVLDWGVACVLPGHDEVGAGLAPGTAELAAGTVGYMAPEQASPERAAPLDVRADVFALGCILFEILAGAPYVEGNPLPSSRAGGKDVPGDLDRVCARALAPDRQARFASARELADAVQRHLDADQQLEMTAENVADPVARARAALEQPGLDGRAAAVREAGLALALEPGCVEAAELLQSVLLSTPDELPPEVLAAVAAQDEAILRTRARASAVSYGMVPAFVPVYLMQGVKDWWLLVGMLGWTAVLVTVALTAMRGLLPRSRMWIAAFGNLGILYVMSRTLGPFVLPPGIAVLVAMQVTTHPKLERWWLVAGVLSAGVIGAWLLEATGTVEPTMRSEDANLVLGSTFVELPAALSGTALALYVVSLITVASYFGRRLASAHNSTRRALAVQAWHLRRLIGGARE
jgi:serine/threonine-protein kinase